MPKVEPAPPPGPVKHAALQQPQVNISALLAARDAQIAELQQAVLELSDRGHGGELPADAAQRIAMLEQRLAEQERTVRHVLTMLIEWFESGQSPRVAA